MSDAAPQPVSKPFITRRRLLGGALGLFGLGLGGVWWARSFEPQWLEEVTQTLSIPGLPAPLDGFRIVQLSDLHHSDKVPLDYLEECYARALTHQPDLIVLTGDFVTDTPRGPYLEPVAASLKTLTAPHGVWAVAGNHDYGLMSPRSAPVSGHRVLERLAHHGVRTLLNEHDIIEVEGAHIRIFGLGDWWADHFDAQAAFKGAPAQRPPEELWLALSHNPDPVEQLVEGGAQVVLSGHTHGGQVVIPLVGPPYVPVVNKERVAGRYQVGQGQLYITRGVGSLFGVRMNCRPELTVLTLTAG